MVRRISGALWSVQAVIARCPVIAFCDYAEIVQRGDTREGL